jgi:hypothetical protein
MPRNMSFMLTTEQILDESKDVTRRLGWANLQPGTRVRACRKCMGLAKGEQVEVLRMIEIVGVRRERLDAMLIDPDYGDREAVREGFPQMTGSEFVAMFCHEMGCDPETEVSRVEFRYLPELRSAVGRQQRLF